MACLHLRWCLAVLTGTRLAGWLVAVHPALPFAAAALLNLPTVTTAIGIHHTLARAGAGFPPAR